MKIIAARIWLSWKLKKNPRVLSNIIDDVYNKVNSKGYNQIGKLVPTNVEIAWEQPHPLKLMTVKIVFTKFLNDSKIIISSFRILTG